MILLAGWLTTGYGCAYPTERVHLIDPVFTAPHILAATDGSAQTGRWLTQLPAKPTKARYWNVALGIWNESQDDHAGTPATILVEVPTDDGTVP